MKFDFFKKIIIFYVFLFWCNDIKNNFKKSKKYYFNIFLEKNNLKNNL